MAPGTGRRNPCWTWDAHAASALSMIAFFVAALSLAIWIYLVFARGGFWLGRERDDENSALPPVPPQVAIVVPARNEAENIAQSVTSLLAQDYPALALVLVDDDSNDGTADVAQRTAAALGKEDRLSFIRAGALPP